MEDLSTTVAEEPATESTVVTDAPPEPAPQHMSPDEAVAKALDDQNLKDEPDEPDDESEGDPEEKPDPKKPEKVEKEARPDKKPKAEDKTEDDKPEDDGEADEKPASKKTEEDKPTKKGKVFHPAPDDFLPTAKEQWKNVPHEVRSEVYRKFSEAQETSERLTQQVERYENIRDFDELAQQNGRDLRESLMRVHHIENLLQTNPLAGLSTILLEAGPRKADGQPYSLFEVASAVVKMGPDGYQRAVAQSQQQQQPDHTQEAEELRARVAALETEAKFVPVIERFKSNHPRYDELEGAIAKLLQSGMVPASLAPDEKLSAAYDMAVRLNPTSHDDPQEEEEEEPAPERRAGKDFGGSRSIKGSPPTGSSRAKPNAKVMSRDEAIDKAMAALR